VTVVGDGPAPAPGSASDEPGRYEIWVAHPGLVIASGRSDPCANPAPAASAYSATTWAPAADGTDSYRRLARALGRSASPLGRATSSLRASKDRASTTAFKSFILLRRPLATSGRSIGRREGYPDRSHDRTTQGGLFSHNRCIHVKEMDGTQAAGILVDGSAASIRVVVLVLPAKPSAALPMAVNRINASHSASSDANVVRSPPPVARRLSPGMQDRAEGRTLAARTPNLSTR
jgi:hypothetical protein